MGHMTRERAWTEIERRIVTGELPGGSRFDEEAVAADVGVETAAVREALCRLERDGFVRAVSDGGFAVAELDEIELREAFPIVILLEGLAVRNTAEFPDEAIARLREINEALGAEAGDPMAAATRDWEFHDELVSHCGNEPLLSTLRPLKRMLLRYEFAYMSTERFVATAVESHAAIVDALEAGDSERAAQLVESNFRDTFGGMLEKLERRREDGRTRR
jgi:DNA-binding GntR family transcriptional regulator